MLTNEQKRVIIDNMITQLELPDFAYEKAKNRYEDLGDWFDREESTVKDYHPHIFSQGSFRLGTAIRPIDETEEYDLDLACKLRGGIAKGTHTQEHLKRVVGEELETYRSCRAIQKRLEAKHRCWRLEYKDDLSFHMDIVPCIPAGKNRRNMIFESMRQSGVEEHIASSASQTTVNITDDRNEGYKNICEDWHISNPEGYASWFEYRMNTTRRIAILEKAQVDDVPLFQRKTPLQKIIQLLKRHRDNMFKGDEDVKPISIIITTLAARAYNGEHDIVIALENILESMEKFVNRTLPRVPNPVDPQEDFADRWAMSKYRTLNLEKNFGNWLKQIKIDFQHITTQSDTQFITKQFEQKFSITVNKTELAKQLGISAATASVIIPKSHAIERKHSAKPWKR
ncbi:MAG: nucleotidyltransferase [Deltaproteobacteria bacterium]|jgi:hypothetical protein|nr:nucleotidyltransferase [Deltaproteobacteria bacterium]